MKVDATQNLIASRTNQVGVRPSYMYHDSVVGYAISAGLFLICKK